VGWNENASAYLPRQHRMHVAPGIRCKRTASVLSSPGVVPSGNKKRDSAGELTGGGPKAKPRRPVQVINPRTCPIDNYVIERLVPGAG
jgi:hypothetical protein